jgi:hypothetical protein
MKVMKEMLDIAVKACWKEKEGEELGGDDLDRCE